LDHGRDDGVELRRRHDVPLDAIVLAMALHMASHALRLSVSLALMSICQAQRGKSSISSLEPARINALGASPEPTASCLLALLYGSAKVLADY